MEYLHGLHLRVLSQCCSQVRPAGLTAPLFAAMWQRLLYVGSSGASTGGTAAGALCTAEGNSSLYGTAFARPAYARQALPAVRAAGFIRGNPPADTGRAGCVRKTSGRTCGQKKAADRSLQRGGKTEQASRFAHTFQPAPLQKKEVMPCRCRAGYHRQ